MKTTEIQLIPIMSSSVCLNTPQYLNETTISLHPKTIALGHKEDFSLNGSMADLGQNGCLSALQSVMAPKGTLSGPLFIKQLEIPLMLVIVSLGMALIVKKVRRP